MSKIDITSKEVPDLYQIKYREIGADDKSDWKYGIVDQYSDEANKCWGKRILLVEDAITPDIWRISLKDWEVVAIESDYPNEYDKFVDSSFKLAYRQSQEAAKEGTLPYRMIRMGVGDGYAFYVVTKENAKTCNIEWRGFSADRWVDRALGYGGVFPKKMIKNLVEGVSLFGSTKEYV